MTDTVSIVTAVYNGEKTIRRAIESVLNQTVACKEYTVVDGLSSDHTVEIAQEYRERFQEKGISYRILSEKDRGIYDAMNKGISLSEGTIIGMINSDDWYEPNAVETVLSAYAKSHFDMMYADLRMYKNGREIGIKRSRKMKHYITSRHWNHPTTFITKQKYETYQYPCLSVYDDLDMLLTAYRDKWNIVVVNEVLANYSLGGSSNRKTREEILNRFHDKYRIYRENGYSRLYILECAAMELGKAILA